jgi:hypothetical protein
MAGHVKELDNLTTTMKEKFPPYNVLSLEIVSLD